MNRYDPSNFSTISPLQSDDEFDGNDLLDYTEEVLSTGSYHTEEGEISKAALFSATSIPTYIDLQPSHSSYVDCEVGGKLIAVTFTLEKALHSNEFIGIRIECLPNCTFQTDFISHIEPKKMKGRDFLDLSLRLIYGGKLSSESTGFRNHRQSQPAIPIKVAVFNGEYCITVSNRTDRLQEGSYILWISAPAPEANREAEYSSIQIQTLKLNLKVVEEVDATAIVANSLINGIVGTGNQVFYRFVVSERNKVVRCSVRTISNKLQRSHSADAYALPASEGVVDLFVTNRFSGLSPVTRETAIWTTDYQINHAVEILPNDINLAQNIDEVGSDTFIIAVYANPEYNISTEVSFEMIIEVEDHKPIFHFPLFDVTSNKDVGGSVLQQSLECLSLPFNEYNFFSIEFDPTERESIAISLNILRPNVSRVPSLWEKHQNISQLRTEKNLANYNYLPGVCPEMTLFQDVVEKSLVENGDSADPFWRLANGAKLKDYSFLVLVYLSNDIKYPNEESNVWMASGKDEVTFVIDAHEWKYVGNTCHFSVFVIDLNAFDFHQNETVLNGPEIYDVVRYLSKKTGYAPTKTTNKVLSQISVWRQSEEEILLSEQLSTANGNSTAELQRHKLFHEIFNSIDGSRLSFKERNANIKKLLQQISPRSISSSLAVPSNNFGNSSDELSLALNPREFPQVSSNHLFYSSTYIDDTTLSYCEIEFSAFSSLIRQCGALDGQIFYDLGCGIGKAVVGAMLSGIRFLKVIGIELLPLLAQCAKDIVTQLLLQNETDNNTLKNSKILINSDKGSENNTSRDALDDAIDFASHSTPVWLRRNYNKGAAMMKKLVNDSDQEDEDEFNRGVETLNLFRDQDVEESSVSSQSYQIHHISNLKDKLKRAKVTIPIFEIRNENILESNWGDADILFSNSLCFSDYFMESLLEKAKLLKKGAKWITCKLPEEYQPFFSLQQTIPCSLTCGVVDFYVLVRSD